MREIIARCFLLFEWRFSIVLKPQWSELHTVGFVETKALVPHATKRATVEMLI